VPSVATSHPIHLNPRTPQPSDSQLAGMHLGRIQYDSIVTLYQHNQDAALQSLPGSIRVSAESEQFTRRTFLDLRVLQAPDSAALAEQQRFLGVIRRYVRAFFDQALRGEGESVLATEGSVDSLITVTHFARPAEWPPADRGSAEGGHHA